MKIIDQPIRRGGGGALFTSRREGRAIRGVQGPVVVAKTPLQPSIGRLIGSGALSRHEALGMLFKPLDPKEFGTDWFITSL
jgi:hypothetical protein